MSGILKSRLPEPTRQQLDPISALGDRILVLVLSLSAFGYSVIVAIRMIPEVSRPPLLILALVATAFASLTVILASSQKFAPFSKLGHICVHLFVIAALILMVLSQLGTDKTVDADFASVTLGMLLLAIGPYRPAVEISTAASVSALLLAFVAMVQASQMPSRVPVAIFALSALAPVAALGFASSRLSGRLVDYLEQWNRSLSQSFRETSAQLSDEVVESVREERLRILESTALPLLQALSESGVVGPEDRARASAISDEIRKVMVAEAERTWLEVAVRDFGAAPERVEVLVSDPKGAAAWMRNDERIALRALADAVIHDSSYVQRSFRVSISADGRNCRGSLAAELIGADQAVKFQLAPYLAVIRILFSDVEVKANERALRIGFGYVRR
ncbi:MAG: hypothetical protein KF808_06340 [Cryobacterium sp.]|nr:hypothetical protein [Cryobacterium sp.]